MDTDTAVTDPVLHPAYALGEKLGAEITELCGYLYAATYRLLVLIREFDEKGCWELPGLTSCAHWLNFKCGIGMNAAREKVRVARALADLPRISAAFERGEVSYSKVRAMTRVANPDNEDYLLMIAHHGSAWHLETLIAKYRRAARNIEAAEAMAQHQHRECEIHYDADGGVVLKARLPADQGAIVVKALEHAMERRFREGRGSDREAAEGPADPGRVSEETAVIPLPEPIGLRRADALAEVAETYLANDSRVSTTADRFQVVVHVSAETLKDEPDATTTGDALGDADLAHVEDGPHVSAETARRVACDAGIVKLTESDDGEPLSIGRKSRAIPPAIRRALKVRDGGCRFPGCTHTRFVDGHHIVHWADDGETGLHNLVLLCRHHHRLVHEGGFRCEHAANGQVVFHAPTGENLSLQRQTTAISKHTDVMRWFDRYLPDLEVDSDTCVARWYAGERIDWDLAVSHLFN